MAELLTHRTGSGNQGPSGYQIGDVVDVQEDNYSWGRMEVGPETVFVRLRVIGEPAADFMHLRESTDSMKRTKRLDLDAMFPGGVPYTADVTAAQVNSNTVVK